MLEWEALTMALWTVWLLAGCFFIDKTLDYVPSQPKGRDFAWDATRGVAMIGIVVIHVHSYYEYFGKSNFFTLYLSNLSRFSVPVFLYSSALFLKKKPGYWSSKVKVLFVPYLLFFTFSYFMKTNNYSLTDFVIRFLTGASFAPYYFIPLLVQFWLLFFLIPESFWKSSWSLKLFPLILLFQLWVSDSNLLRTEMGKAYPSFFGHFVAFFYLGAISKKLEKYLSSPLPYLLPIILTILLFIPTLKGINLRNNHWVYPIAFSLFIPLLMREYLEKIPKTIKFLAEVGEKSIWILLIHPMLMHFLHGVTIDLPVYATILPIIALNVLIPVRLSRPLEAANSWILKVKS